MNIRDGIRSVAEQALEAGLYLVDVVAQATADSPVWEVASEVGERIAAEVWGIAGVVAHPQPSGATGSAKALRHQVGDAVVVVGSYDPRWHVEAAEGELVIHALGKDGAKQAVVRLKPNGDVVVDAARVFLGNDSATEGVGLGTTIKSHLDALKSYIDAHTHPFVATGAVSPTSVPTSPSPAVPTVASTKHKVEG